VSLGSANRRLGVILQEKILPFFKLYLLTLADNLENAIVPSLESFAGWNFNDSKTASFTD
jgi:hypothetical protein